MPIALILHVASGGIGILSGAIALAAAKGGRLHRCLAPCSSLPCC